MYDTNTTHYRLNLNRINNSKSILIEESDKEEIKNSIDNCNDDDIMSSNGLVFSNYSSAQHGVNNNQSALEFVDFIETPFYRGPKVQSLNLMVTYQQMNFCGDEQDHEARLRIRRERFLS